MSSQAYSDAVQLVLSMLNTGPDVQLDASDVQLSLPSVSQLGTDNYTVSVNTSIYIYVPATLHRKDLATSRPSSRRGRSAAHQAVQAGG